MLREPLPTCREVVEVITDYLENRMTVADRERFERHVAICEGCTTYLDQVRLTIQASRAVDDEAIPEAQREDLVKAFRDLFH